MIPWSARYASRLLNPPSITAGVDLALFRQTAQNSLNSCQGARKLLAWLSCRPDADRMAHGSQLSAPPARIQSRFLPWYSARCENDVDLTLKSKVGLQQSEIHPLRRAD